MVGCYSHWLAFFVFRAGIRWLCDDDFDLLQILTLDGDEVGKISKQWSGLVREMFTDADFFGITFPMDLDVRMKAVMLGACFLIVSRALFSDTLRDFMILQEKPNIFMKKKKIISRMQCSSKKPTTKRAIVPACSDDATSYFSNPVQSYAHKLQTKSHVQYKGHKQVRNQVEYNKNQQIASK